MFTMRPAGPCLFLSVPKRGAKAWITTSGETMLTSNCRLYSLGLRYRSGPLTTIPALFTRPTRFLPPIMDPTFWAARCTASASVMSIMRGTKPLPNSLCKRSASACLRTEPNTRNPFETSTFVVPQPIPEETPVTTTSLLLLFAFAFLLRRSLFIFNVDSVHLGQRHVKVYSVLYAVPVENRPSNHPYCCG